MNISTVSTTVDSTEASSDFRALPQSPRSPNDKIEDYKNHDPRDNKPELTFFDKNGKTDTLTKAPKTYEIDQQAKEKMISGINSILEQASEFIQTQKSIQSFGKFDVRLIQPLLIELRSIAFFQSSSDDEAISTDPPSFSTEQKQNSVKLKILVNQGENEMISQGRLERSFEKSFAVNPNVKTPFDLSYYCFAAINDNNMWRRFSIDKLDFLVSSLMLEGKIDCDTVRNYFFPVLLLISSDDYESYRMLACIKIIRTFFFLFTLEKSEERTKILDEAKHVFLGITISLLKDSSADVHKQAAKTLVTLCRFLRRGEVICSVLPVILHLSQDVSEEANSTAIELMHSLCFQLGELYSVNFLAKEFKYLSQKSAAIRKVLAKNFLNLSLVCGYESFKADLYPIFKNLARDSDWMIRLHTIENFSPLSQFVKERTVKRKLFFLFKNLLIDNYITVREKAAFYISDILVHYGSAEVDQGFIRSFLAFFTSSNVKLLSALSRTLIVVARAIGRNRWQEISFIFEVMANHPNKKVRVIVVNLIPSLSAVLGEEIAKKKLYHHFLNFLSDCLDVKRAVVTNSALFMKQLSDFDLREKLLEAVLEEAKVCKRSSWRFILTVADQISAVLSILPAVIIRKSIIPFVFSLLDYPFHQVRQRGAHLTGEMLRFLERKGDLEYFETFMNRVELMATADSFVERQTYIKICGAVIGRLTKSTFEKYFEPNVKMLSRDNVVNVRLVVATFFRENFFKIKPRFLKEMEELREDKDVDVRYEATF